MKEAKVRSKENNFVFLDISKNNAKVVNVFVHGYSSGHDLHDRFNLIKNIPKDLPECLNVMAFWNSSHFLRVNSTSRKLISLLFFVYKPAAVGAFVIGRGAHFLKMRARAEECGATLLEELDRFLIKECPYVEHVNLIGHSLGGRVIVHALKGLINKRAYDELIVRDVLLMAAAVDVQNYEAAAIINRIEGKVYNAYSPADLMLQFNGLERSIGLRSVPHFENTHMTLMERSENSRNIFTKINPLKNDSFGHTDYWPNLRDVLVRSKIFSPGKGVSAQSTTEVIKPNWVVEDRLLFEVLERAPLALLETIVGILKLKSPDDSGGYCHAEAATKEIQRIGGGVLGNAIRQSGVPYAVTLQDLGTALLGPRRMWDIVRISKLEKLICEELDSALEGVEIMSVFESSCTIDHAIYIGRV